MSKVFTALAVPVDGFITGRDPGPGHGSATVACLTTSGWNWSRPCPHPESPTCATGSRESMLEPDVRRLLGSTAVAHLATVLPDGSPHSVPVFVGAEGDRIAFFTGPGSRKARNLRRDPRVALSVAPPDDPFTPVIVRGRVVEWIGGEAGWEIVDRIAKRYTGQPYPREQERVVALIEPSVQRIGMG